MCGTGAREHEPFAEHFRPRCRSWVAWESCRTRLLAVCACAVCACVCARACAWSPPLCGVCTRAPLPRPAAPCHAVRLRRPDRGGRAASLLRLHAGDRATQPAQDWRIATGVLPPPHALPAAAQPQPAPSPRPLPPPPVAPSSNPLRPSQPRRSSFLPPPVNRATPPRAALRRPSQWSHRSRLPTPTAPRQSIRTFHRRRRHR